MEAGGYGSAFMRDRVRLLTGRAVIGCEGTEKVERAVIARLGRDWEPVRGSEQRVSADAVCVSYGFVPRLELARQLGARDMASPGHPGVRVAADEMMGSSAPGLFIVGELAGVAGADVAELEGELAGHGAASYLGLPDYRRRSEHQRAARRLRSGRAFAARLENLYVLRPGWLSWLERSSVFCRCEQTSWKAVEAAIIHGASSAAKSETSRVVAWATARDALAGRRYSWPFRPSPAGLSTRSVTCTSARWPYLSRWKMSPGKATLPRSIAGSNSNRRFRSASTQRRRSDAARLARTGL